MVKASYPDKCNKTNDLLTYPTLLMGVGNLISMPVAMAAGRRIVFLTSMVILIVGGLWCALSSSLESHIAGRAIMSLAAGQSEALAPLKLQEIFFLHEKGRRLGWFITIQNITSGAFFIVSTYLVAAYGWKWWYGLFTIMNAVLFLLSIVFVSETCYRGREDKSHSPTLDNDDQRSDEKTNASWRLSSLDQHWTPRRTVRGLGEATSAYSFTRKGGRYFPPFTSKYCRACVSPRSSGYFS